MNQPSPQNAQAAAAPQQNGSRGAAFAMFGLLLIAYVLMSADRYLVSAFGKQIQEALSLSGPQRGTLTTIFTLGLGIAGLPAGWLIARSSRKTVLMTGIVIFSLATALATVAGGFGSMFGSLVLQGIGMAMLATSMFSLASSYFAKNRVAAVGAVNVCFGLGAIVAPIIISFLAASSKTWQETMQTFAAFGIVLVVLIALTVRPWFSETQHAAHYNEGTGGADTLKNRNTIILAVLSVIYGLNVYGFIGSYPTFLQKAEGYDLPGAITMIKFFGYGSLLSIFGGMLGDKFSPKWVIIIFSVLAIVLGDFLFRPGLSVSAHKWLAFSYGFVGPAVLYTNLAGAHIKSLRRNLSRLGSSMFVSSIYAGAACGGFLMSYLAERFSWQQAANIQMSLLTLIGAVLALGLRTSEMSK